MIFGYGWLKTIFNFLAGISVLLLIGYYTIFNGQSKTWGIFRFAGLLGFFFSAEIIYYGCMNEGKINIIKSMDNRYFLPLMIIFLTSIIIFILGEFFLYLNKLQDSIEQIQRFLSSNSDYVICPRCLGKGFVDLEDISRLGKANEWHQGPCSYCVGCGKVTSVQIWQRNPLKGSQNNSTIPSL